MEPHEAPETSLTFPPTHHTKTAMPDWEQCEGNDEVLPVTYHNEYVHASRLGVVHP